MASPIYMWIEDEAGNPIEGSVTISDNREGSIEVIEMKHNVEIPTDKHTGALTGMRRHNALEITKAVDKSSAELFQAVTSGKTLKNVVLRFYNINDEGVEQEYYRIEYADVKVSSFTTELMNVKDPEADRFPHIERIALRYKKMTVNYADGNLTHSDSWEERASKAA